jgi:hypothetical protein
MASLPTPRPHCTECLRKDAEVNELRTNLERQRADNREQIRQQLYEMQGQGSGRSSRRSFRTGEIATQTTPVPAEEECKASERVREAPSRQASSQVKRATKKAKAATPDGGSIGFNNRMLMNNYLRSVKQFLQNLDSEGGGDYRKENLARVDQIANAQQIILLDEEDDDSDSSHVTPGMMKEVVELSLRVAQELIAVKAGSGRPGVQFELTLPHVKEMAAESKADRKSCHAIIVEIERQMYELGNTFSKVHGARTGGSAVEAALAQFNEIQTTYLKLPLRLKPIFDHSKKLETVLSKALKQQAAAE